MCREAENANFEEIETYMWRTGTIPYDNFMLPFVMANGLNELRITQQLSRIKSSINNAIGPEVIETPAGEGEWIHQYLPPRSRKKEIK